MLIARTTRAATRVSTAHREAVGLGFGVWSTVLAGSAVSLVCYLFLLTVVQHLQTAEPSYAGEVFSWVPRLTRETMAKDHDLASLRFLAILAILFISYAVVLRAVAGQRSRWLALALFAGGALGLLVQLTQPAMLSTDVFSYTLYGRIFAVYHGDPYVKLPYRSIDDPYLPLAYDLPWPSWYGPLWTLVSGGLALVGGERIGLTVALFRGLAIAGVLAASGLIWAILRRVAPERAAQGLVFYLWNPLVVLEAGMSGHNDGVMLALLLGGIWLFVGGRRVLAIVAFSLSVLIKLVTGLVVPLFVLLALRSRTWPGRLRYVGQVGLAAALVFTAAFSLVRTGVGLPVLQAASASNFYENNVYELLFRGLRRGFGEDEASVRTPVHFIPWWGKTQNPARLRDGPSASARQRKRVPNGSTVVVLAPPEGSWLRAYVPGVERTGYLERGDVAPGKRPAAANADPVLAQAERNPVTGLAARRANTLLRTICWTTFAALALLAAWRAIGLRSVLVWSVVLTLASYWLVATETWPWYMNWALALAALVPASRPALLAALLSATALSLYVTIGFDRTNLAWLYTYRSLPAFVLPVVLFLGLCAARRLAAAIRTRRPAPTESTPATGRLLREPS